MQLYTVKMTTKKLVSVFDAKGKKVDEKTEEVAITFTDLPLQTAQMYRDRNKDGNVQVIVQQPTAASGARYDRSAPGSHASRGERRASKPTAAPAARPAPFNINDAARTGDLAAALNQR